MIVYMNKIQITKYVAVDGVKFDDELSCRVYEGDLIKRAHEIIKSSTNCKIINITTDSPIYNLLRILYAIQIYNQTGIDEVNFVCMVFGIKCGGVTLKFDKIGNYVIDASKGIAALEILNFDEIMVKLNSVKHMIDYLYHIGSGENEE